MITEVLITVDTEFSIAGAFNNLAEHPPLGRCSVNGRVGAREHGLGFLLGTLKKHEIKATFFVEAINTCYFGPEEMGQIARRIAEDGQDVQLHVHPVWAVFQAGELRDSTRFPRNDSLLERDESQITDIFEIGLSAFNSWGLPRPVAIRTGSLLVNENMYKVFESFDLNVSSSVGTGIYMPEQDNLQLDSGKVTINGVAEIPVTTFRDLPRLNEAHRKSVQITSCSWPEIRAVLLKANALGIPRVTILTHPFEFFKRKDFRHSKITRNRVNQQRFANLCRFLSENASRFSATTFAEGAERWRAEPDVVDPVIESTADIHAGIRKVHNGINDAIWRY